MKICAIKRFFFQPITGMQGHESDPVFKFSNNTSQHTPNTANRLAPFGKASSTESQPESISQSHRPPARVCGPQCSAGAASVVGHHLGRYSCGSLLKFLLWRAWSTVLMKESIIFLMGAVKGSKEGCLAPERLK